MTAKEAILLEALTKQRAQIVEVLELPAVRGFKDSVVDKYSDQAHFVYELLQNADDAKAKSASFVVESNRLIFKHNGTRHFSVTDPQNEDEDKKNGSLGDINSITSIANSNKVESSIGKFGVGFKAVFQYTSTPHIYDPNFCFKIERFLVPIALTEDFCGRKKDETCFVFPFDHQKINAEEAYNDISEKLKSLSYPLLFLTNLKDISFEFDGVIGMYGKQIKETISFGNTTAEHIILTQNIGDNQYDDELWLFSRKYESNGRYSVGFFLNQEGGLRPITVPAFCFFPTKEDTNLNFVIHAPFLLTDSREGIRAGVEHNELMIKYLADLASDALILLRDIGKAKRKLLIDNRIVDIIPIDKEKYSNPLDKSRISFRLFYDSIINKFKETELIPTADGYVLSKNAYWASSTQLSQLFSNTQLGEMVNNAEAKWAFPARGREEVQRNNLILYRYINEIIGNYLDEDAIILGKEKIVFCNGGYRREKNPLLTETFIERQNLEWLHKLYKWISDNKNRRKSSLNKPIFLNQDRKASAAYDANGHLILFLPVKENGGYNVVYDELLKNNDTLEFIKSIGITQPSLKDQIYNIILPQYTEGANLDTDSHFLTFLEYYNSCSREDSVEFINLIKKYEFLLAQGDTKKRNKAEDVYMPNDNLIRFFSYKKTTRFLDLNYYKSLVGKESESQLNSFLVDLGVRTSPIIYRSNNNTYNKKVTERYIDGLEEVVNAVAEKQDKDLSAFLWKQLCVMVEKKVFSERILAKTIETRPDGRYKFKTEKQFSKTRLFLNGKRWLVNKEGSFVFVGEANKKNLSDIYDLESEEAVSLLSLLGIPDTSFAEGDDSKLTVEQREKIAFADRCKDLGIDENDLADYLEFKRQKKAREQARGRSEASHYNTDNQPNYKQTALDETVEIDKLFNNDAIAPSEKNIINKATSNVIKDIARRTRGKIELSVTETTEDIDIDEDDYLHSTVDYRKKIENAKQKSAAEIDRIAYFEELQNKAIAAERYSYGWFSALLEMESINSGEADLRSREISINFARVEREPETKRTLVLKHPDKYIPQFMEDLADIPLVLHMGEQTKTVAIEVANIKSYTLRAKLKNAEVLDGLDLSKVTSASIDAKSPAFLLEELRKRFDELGYADEFNMQENLCENIEFVFGPPGTGKTTYLAKNVLMPIMENSHECKVLVLTPTNKSADVLVKRIMEVSGEDNSYKNWLVRFGATGDEEIEQSPVFKDKEFDIREMSKNVTVTTIARFPYDFFMPAGVRIFLQGINWDYIIIDEASMIPLVNIIYPLYKKTPKKFIIAGDPFQIEPITSVDLWKNENIYTMVHLDSFINPQTVPYRYKVELLTTQYRSIPDIGDVFSKFAYGGILKHNRTTDSQRRLNVSGTLGIKTLNVIKFPVSKYESIYRCKRLQHSSSYQVYSALFIFEYVSYLSREISANNPNEEFRIGIIAPYRAQADLIDKLLASEEMPQNIDVQVGTIHGFQGDECDIIFAVFNTPPSISNSKDMFLNKLNIINVSISRARDYLFVVMPDDETENIYNLRLIKNVEELLHDTDAWNEFLSPDLEKIMFGDSRYLENNAFSTSHQSVNVYGLPEKVYEIRTEETAVDVQIHKR